MRNEVPEPEFNLFDPEQYDEDDAVLFELMNRPDEPRKLTKEDAEEEARIERELLEQYIENGSSFDRLPPSPPHDESELPF